MNLLKETALTAFTLSAIFWLDCATPTQPNFTTGRIDGNTYYNDVVGFSITKPDTGNWTISAFKDSLNTTGADSIYTLTLILKTVASGFAPNVNVLVSKQPIAASCSALRYNVETEYKTDTTNWINYNALPGPSGDTLTIGKIPGCIMTFDITYVGDKSLGPRNFQIQQLFAQHNNYLVVFTYTDITTSFLGRTAEFDAITRSISFY